MAYFLLGWAIPQLLSKVIHSFDPSALKDYGRTKPHTIIEVISDLLQVAILTPIIEEIMYRGYLFTEFRKFKMPVVAVIIVTSLLFGFMHYPPWVWVVDTIIFGVIMAIIRQKTGSIWTGLGVHIATNCIAYFMLFYR